MECIEENLERPETFSSWIRKCPETISFYPYADSCPLARFLQDSCHNSMIRVGIELHWIWDTFTPVKVNPLWAIHFTRSFDKLFHEKRADFMTKKDILPLLREIEDIKEKDAL